MDPYSPDLQWDRVLFFGGLLVGLLLLESRLGVTESTHRALQIGIVLIVYGIMALQETGQTLNSAQLNSRRGREPDPDEIQTMEDQKPLFGSQPEEQNPRPGWLAAFFAFLSGLTK